ncbi:MAG: PqqD family protein [Sphingomonadaceae bacterium]
MRYRIASPRVVHKVIEGEAVVINLDTGFYYGIEGPAACVWQALAGGASDADILAGLERRYPGREPLEADLRSFIADAVAAGLIAEADGEAKNGPDPETLDWPEDYQRLAMICYDDVAEMVALDPPLPELESTELPQARRA